MNLFRNWNCKSLSNIYDGTHIGHSTHHRAPRLRRGCQSGFAAAPPDSGFDRLAAAFEVLVADTEQPGDNTSKVCAKHGARYVPREGRVSLQPLR